MIKYNLKCHNDHEFESWFSDSSEFENLKKRRLLECILCSSKKINKSIMSPMISSTKKNNTVISEVLNKSLKNEKNKLLQLKKFGRGINLDTRIHCRVMDLCSVDDGIAFL